MPNDAAETATPEAVLQLGMAFWGSKTLLTAVELGLFTELAAQGPGDLATLTRRLGLHGRGANDFLDALVALGMLRRDEAGRYANTVQAGLYLDRAKPSYLGGLLEMANRRLYPFWGHLTEALRTGQPQNEARDGGADPFAAIYADPQTLEIFLRAMSGASRPTARAIADSFPWSEHKSFVDIGCAQGALVATVALAHPHLAAGGFDLPPVRPVFERHMAEMGLADRARFQPGNFFDEALPAAEVLVMGQILHDWGLPEKMMLLREAHDALPPGGALIVYDAMIDDDRRRNAFGLLMSLNMLIETPAGFDYTGADCVGWALEAGFAEARVQHLVGPHSMMVARKAK
ncbi:MAG: O-methyltransferase family 2 [Rubritepida sp.]|nr:O-methyltransferase family 2 [Rubritepida sp.]